MKLKWEKDGSCHFHRNHHRVAHPPLMLAVDLREDRDDNKHLFQIKIWNENGRKMALVTFTPTTAMCCPPQLLIMVNNSMNLFARLMASALKWRDKRYFGMTRTISFDRDDLKLSMFIIKLKIMTRAVMDNLELTNMLQPEACCFSIMGMNSLSPPCLFRWILCSFLKHARV